ncbi:MFS transporter [Salinicoccus hispanicus]|uniref:Quinolone resistance protein NorA n=1 Tax=Salinicoccus hispanicus TaxID=157225 RepID=A0A6N8TX24_9STAP|nr:MFS transporter [Salinicoccus hispanicus]MXQ50474.1 MFS transporter [Salinicoccus hispanicus]
MSKNFSRKTILFVFMIGTFAIGMTEYVVTGLLTQFSEDLDVPLSATGMLLSVYAISVAVFGPILRILTLKSSQRKLLIIFAAIFTISNIIAATAPNFEVLLASRLAAASIHAPFFGLCMSIAVDISAPNRRTGAIAAVQGGLTIAVMVGVPFGALIGGLLDWRVVFWIIAVFGLITLIGVIIVTPRVEQKEPPALMKELSMLKDKNVVMVLAMIIFGFSGVFAAYTFNEPMLREISGFGVTGVTLSLLAFGVGAVFANALAGRVLPINLTRSLLFSLLTLGLILFAFTFLLSNPVLAIMVNFLFGAGVFGTAPLLNSKVIIAAKESPALSGTITASTFNLANAIGATIGSTLLERQLDYPAITFVAGTIIFVGFAIMVVTSKIEDRSLYE